MARCRDKKAVCCEHDNETCGSKKGAFNDKGNKLPSTQLLSVIYLMWKDVSTSEGHL